jgi:hypothetical protein
MGIYPQPFLQRMKPAVDLTLMRVFTVSATPTSTNHEPSRKPRE